MTKYDSNSKRVDYKLIEWLLANMDSQTKLYKLVKAEMVKRGHWKAKSRGRPFKSGQDTRRHDLH